MADQNDPVVNRVRQKLVSGEITQDQAAKVLQAYKAYKAQTAQPKPESATPPLARPAPGATPFPSEPAPVPAAVAEVPTQPAQPSVMDQAKVAQGMYGMARTGALETLAQILSGAGAEVASGLSGLAALPFVGPERAAKGIDYTREALTYQPRTPTGQAMSGALGEKLAPVGEAFEAAQQATGEAGYQAGGPAVGAVTSAIPALAAEIVGVRGSRVGARSRRVGEAVEATEAIGPENLTSERVAENLREAGFTDQQIREISAGGETREAVLQSIQEESPEKLKAIQELSAQTPEEMERLARFRRLGVSPTRGDVTQKLEDQKLESQLLETAQDEAGATMRQARRGQTQALAKNIEELATGSSDDAGETVKSALESRREITKREARQAYQMLAQEQGISDAPLMIGEIPGMPTGSERRAIERVQKSNVRALDELMVEFGLKKDPALAKSLAARDIPIQPLTLANFEEFRQALSPIEAADQTGNMGRLIGPLRRELDKQVDLMSETLEVSGNANVAELAKQARMNWRAYKEEFDPKSLTNQLIADRPRSTIPQVEASNVYNKVAANATPVEQVDRLYQSLKKEGAKGRRAIADLQSSMLMDTLDSAFKGVTRKVDGQPMISGPAMAKRFSQLENKAKIIFQDNPQALRIFTDVIEAAKDITPQNIAVPKGSAGFLMDAFQQMGVLKLGQAIPGGGFVIEGLRELGARSANRKSLNKALNANPGLSRTAKILAADYPSLATAIGIGHLVTGEDNKSEE